MRTEKALSDLAEIRQRLQLIDARSSFRCFSLAISSLIFLIAAFAQPAIDGSLKASIAFATYWLAISVVCAISVALEVWWRSVSARSRVTFEWSCQLATAMLPVITVAALTTWALMSQPQLTPTLPGIWAIFAGLSIVACARLLPTLCQAACLWWIGGGVLSIRFYELIADHLTLTMSLLFGAGQLLLAVCLFAGARSSR